MRIAIASDGDKVAEHFGRCPSYTLVDIENGNAVHREVLDNPGHEPGRIPVFLKEHGAEVIVAGGMGRRAQMLFDQMGIQQVLGITGPVDQVVSSCIHGSLEGAESLCAHGEGHGDGHGPGADGGDHDCGSHHQQN